MKHEKSLRRVYGGILPIGPQGCSFFHGIVLNGKYKGRVVNLNTNGQTPQFAFEDNFLDWYERWLDEVISGELAKAGSGWFGYNKGGTEEELLACFIRSGELELKRDCLKGLLNKSKLKDQTIDQINSLILLIPVKRRMIFIC